MSTDSEFKYDVFLSHSKSDEVVVREIANRLNSDGCGCGLMTRRSSPATTLHTRSWERM
jgi:hypothetical protein